MAGVEVEAEARAVTGCAALATQVRRGSRVALHVAVRVRLPGSSCFDGMSGLIPWRGEVAVLAPLLSSQHRATSKALSRDDMAIGCLSLYPES